MGNAGRVLLIPKGEFNISTTYYMLDLVYSQGSSYVCKKTSVNHPLTDTEYWQLVASASVIKIIDTLQAGETSITFTNNSILSTSTILVYTTIQGLVYNNIVFGTNTVTISFDEQTEDVDVQIVIIN